MNEVRNPRSGMTRGGNLLAIVAALVIVSLWAMNVAKRAPEIAMKRGEAQAGLEQAVVNQMKNEIELFLPEAFRIGGGPSGSTATEMARDLVRQRNAAMAPMPGDPKIPGPEWKYVMEKPDAPWRIVAVPDDEKGTIRLDVYGRSTEEIKFTSELSLTSP